MKKKDRFIGPRVNPARIYHDTQWLDEAIERSLDWNFPDPDIFEQLLDQKLSEHSADRIPKDIGLGNQVPVASLEVNQNKLAVSLGFGTVVNDNPVFREMIPAGSALPCERKDYITTIVDHQTKASQKIYLSKTDPPDLDGADYLGVIEIVDIEPMKAGEPSFETVFSVDSSGGLYVKTYDHDSQRAYNASFTLSQPHMYDHKVGRWRDREGRFTYAPQEMYNQRADAVFTARVKEEEQAEREQKNRGKNSTDGQQQRGSGGINLSTSGALTVLLVAYGLAIIGVAGALVYALIKQA